MREKQRTGAATLETHIDANVETNILASRTQCGLVPALLRINVAASFAILCLLNAAASEKPPSSSIITGLNISENINFAVDFASSRSPEDGSTMTLKHTTRRGIVIDVTKSGRACLK